MRQNITETDEYIIDNSVFRIGQVFSVQGRAVKVKVDKGKNTSSVLYKGDVIQNISVGGYIKIKKGFSVMIGKIEGESITEDTNFTNSTYKNANEKINRILNIKILGFIENGTFQRGIKELPLLDNNCYLLRKEEFNEIHKFVDKDDRPIHIGSLEFDSGQKIELGINNLFASHIGIFGNTGSGKSYTLARIYSQLFKNFNDSEDFKINTQFYIFDFNGEYVHEDTITARNSKNIYKLATNTQEGGDKFPVQKKTLMDNTFWGIFLEATEKTQTPFLNRAIKDTYLQNNLNQDDTFKTLLADKIRSATSVSGRNVDRSITEELLFELANFLNNESIRRVAAFFQENLSGGNENISFHLVDESGNRFFNDNEGFNTIIQEKINTIQDVNLNALSEVRKTGLRIVFKYYDEMIRGFSNREHLSPLIKRLEKRIYDLEKVLIIDENRDEDNTKNISIVSLKDVNLDIRKMLPMLICKELYGAKKLDNNKDKSLHLIIDEAHNILSASSDRESAQWKDYRLETFEEIIKEGRKFGTFLTIASQRPSDISPTILSQLHNYFLHRLINNNDLLAVEKTIAYLDKVSADSIPNLATGTCILAGLVAQIPVVVKISPFEESVTAPDSQTINLLDKWVPL